MKHFTLKLTIFLLCVFSNCSAWAFDLDWAHRFGNTFTTNANSPCVGFSMAVDDSGNVYTIGLFGRTVNFNPSGSANLTAASTSWADIYILKLDAAGNYVWAKRIGGTTGHDEGYDIEVDSKGDVYAVGRFRGTVDFDPGSATANLTAPGAITWNGFVLKLKRNGDFDWVKQIHSSVTNQTRSLELDKNDNVYVTGFFNGSADTDFDYGGAGHMITGRAGQNSDIFTLKLRPNGDFVWVKTIGGTGNDMGVGLALDAQANVYLSGTFTGTVEFDPGVPASGMTGTGSPAYFISKLDSNGNYRWARQFTGVTTTGTPGITNPALTDPIYSNIAVDSAGNVHYIGSFQGTVDFNPGTGTNTLSTPGAGYNAFIVKLNMDGDYVWSRKAGESYSFVKGNAVDVDRNGNVFCTGFFGTGTADFDPSPTDSLIFASRGSFDMYLSKLDTNGNLLKTAQMGGKSWDEANHVLVNQGNIYLTGRFWDSADFSPNPNTQFILDRLGANYNIPVIKIRDICKDTTIKDVVAACDTYIWIDGNTYTSNNTTAIARFRTLFGCDSIVTLDLTVSSSFTATDIQKGCDSFTWIDGHTYTSSNNTATFTLPSVAGCDSFVTLNLTVYHLEAIIRVDRFDLSTTETFTTYQWMLNGIPIAGATQSIYTVLANGDYQVVVTNENGCTDTSDVYAVRNYSDVGIPEQTQLRDQITTGPNPFNDILYINSPAEITATLSSIDGKVILQEKNPQKIATGHLAEGVYFLRITNKEGHFVKTEKIVKQHQ